MPGVQQTCVVVRDQRGQALQLMLPETTVMFKSNRTEPELCPTLVPLYVHMGRFQTIS